MLQKYKAGMQRARILELDPGVDPLHNRCDEQNKREADEDENGRIAYWHARRAHGDAGCVKDDAVLKMTLCSRLLFKTRFDGRK